LFVLSQSDGTLYCASQRGLSLDSQGQSRGITREHCCALPAPLLQQGEIHHRGHFFSADLSLPAPAPIPVLMAALGPAAFRLAGEIADGILPFLCPIPYLLNTALPTLCAGAAALGRPRPPIVAHVPVALTEDRATALRAGREGLGFYNRKSILSQDARCSGFLDPRS
jgi:alkanesulfonate monooxygenase SsuD/methylene tetrahydromethanopterin reductase-like flavin-dependent oxidoreductase (luciferase family)